MNQDAVPLVDRIAFGAIVVAVGARVMIAFSSMLIFDMDPAIDASPFIGATPAESLLLDALAFGSASWLLVRRMLSEKTIDWSWVLIAFACIPAIILALIHGATDAEQLWRGSTWVAGIAIALALIAQNGGSSATFLRRMIVASLAGIAVVMCVRGVAQLTSEHISNVQYYTANRDAFLRSQGWLPNSPQTLSYERRLFQNEATGWFGFSNVFATVAAGSAVLMANIAIGRGVVAGSFLVVVLHFSLCWSGHRKRIERWSERLGSWIGCHCCRSTLVRIGASTSGGITHHCNRWSHPARNNWFAMG